MGLHFPSVLSFFISFCVYASRSTNYVCSYAYTNTSACALLIEPIRYDLLNQFEFNYSEFLLVSIRV